MTWINHRNGGTPLGTVLAIEPHRKRPDTALIVLGNGSKEFGPPPRYRIPVTDVTRWVRPMKAVSVNIVGAGVEA